MEKKPDKDQRSSQEIKNLKKKQSDLESKKRELEESLAFVSAKRAILEKVPDQTKAIGELRGGVKVITKQADKEMRMKSNGN